MPKRAKLFATPEGQAVRLPEEYRFDPQEEVLVYKEGRRVILEPERRRWSRRFLKVAGSAPDFPFPGEAPPAEQQVPRIRSPRLADPAEVSQFEIEVAELHEGRSDAEV